MDEQRSEDWFKSRMGKVTASRMADVMAKTKSGYSTSRKNYMMELICQKLTGEVPEGFTSAAMQRGTDLEPVARSWYEVERDCIVDVCGFYVHPEVEGFGASPDGLVGDDGLLEIKCPNTAQHVDFLTGGEIPRKYQLQMTAQLLCTGRKWCDFVSFDDRMPEHLQGKVVRFEPTERDKAEMITEVVSFLDEMADVMKSLEAL